MAGNDFLLDTNVIVPWINDDVDVADKIIMADSIYISSIVTGELYYGAMNSGNIQKNINRLELTLANYPKLNVDDSTAFEFGKIKAALKKKDGLSIPDNDIWIASLAIQHKLTLITRDKHFKEVAGLHVKHW